MLGATLGCGQGSPRARATLQPLAGQSSKQDCKTFKNTEALFPRSAARQCQALTCGSHSRWKEGVPIRGEGSLPVPQ